MGKLRIIGTIVYNKIDEIFRIILLEFREPETKWKKRSWFPTARFYYNNGFILLHILFLAQIAQICSIEQAAPLALIGVNYHCHGLPSNDHQNPRIVRTRGSSEHADSQNSQMVRNRGSWELADRQDLRIIRTRRSSEPANRYNLRIIRTHRSSELKIVRSRGSLQLAESSELPIIKTRGSSEPAYYNSDWQNSQIRTRITGTRYLMSKRLRRTPSVHDRIVKFRICDISAI